MLEIKVLIKERLVIYIKKMISIPSLTGQYKIKH